MPCFLPAIIILLCTASAIAQDGRCNFSGAPQDQARCLLRPVKPYGKLGDRLTSLPEPLDTIVGKPVSISKELLRRYLIANGINEAELGGSLDRPLSRTKRGKRARYFIIHDTSSPLYERNRSFPENINDEEWSGNRLSGYVRSKKAHAFINRAGQSATSVDFSKRKLTTKYERRNPGQGGLFLGIELIQPRRKDSGGIDAESPTPGFTEAQLDRLALIYMAASVRGGEWLIPAFHAVIDTGLRNAHDDPQDFDLDNWAERLKKMIALINN